MASSNSEIRGGGGMPAPARPLYTQAGTKIVHVYLFLPTAFAGRTRFTLPGRCIIISHNISFVLKIDVSILFYHCKYYFG